MSPFLRAAATGLLAGAVMLPSSIAWATAPDAEPPGPSSNPEDGESDPEDGESDLAAFVSPLVGYDTNLKLGYGGFGQVVWADPTGQTPFRASIGAQAYATTGGFKDHFLNWDLPGIGGSRFRWDAWVRYRAWSRAPYFGLGASPLRRPDEDVSDTYYLWGSERWFLWTNLRRRIGETPWESYATLIASLQSVDLYADSLLAAEQPPGVNGGMQVILGVGGFRDTRSNEIDPTDGSVVDLQVRASSPWIGSMDEWWGIHASLRRWWSAHDRVVLAGRAMVDGTWGDTPFFQQTAMGGLQRGAYGGRFFLRGLQEERLRVDGIAGLQGELRWHFASATLLRRIDLGFQLAPFMDLAQAWMWTEQTDLDPWFTTGAGLRMNIKQLLILRADAGLGWERYVSGDPRRPQLQVYILAGHPF